MYYTKARQSIHYVFVKSRRGPGNNLTATSLIFFPCYRITFTRGKAWVGGCVYSSSESDGNKIDI